MGAIACDEDLPGTHVRILLRKSEIRSRVMPEKNSTTTWHRPAEIQLLTTALYCGILKERLAVM